jgi:hypothetical protein
MGVAVVGVMVEAGVLAGTAIQEWEAHRLRVALGAQHVHSTSNRYILLSPILTGFPLPEDNK